MTRTLILASAFLTAAGVLLLPTSRLTGSCDTPQCDTIPPLHKSGTDPNGGCQVRQESGKVVAYGWSLQNATTKKMYSTTKNLLNVDPTKDGTVETAQYRKQSTSICAAQCKNVYWSRGTAQSPRDQWTFDANVPRYKCTMATMPPPPPPPE